MKTDFKEIAEKRNKRNSESKGTKQPVIMAGFHDKSEKEKNLDAGNPDKFYFLSDISSLPEISLDDSHFGETVCNEYNKIPFDDLCWLIRDIRDSVQKYKTDFEAGMSSMDANFWEKLCGKGIEFESISITSNKGTIELPASHIIFKHFFYPRFKKIKLLQRDFLESQSKGQKFYMVDLPFNKIWQFLSTTKLEERPFQKRVVTGMFLVYFNLNKGKPLMTEIEWNRNPTYAKNYKRYLSDTVRDWIRSS